MAGKTNLTATLFAQKKLLGKANTSAAKSDSQEVIGSNIQAGAQTLFAEDIPDNPERTLHLLQSASNGGPATVEYVQFDLTSIGGTTYDANDYDSDASAQSAGPHAYKLALSGTYQTNSSNPNKGNGVFNNSKTIYETLGACQLVPPNFSGQSPNPYILKLYKETPSDANEIPLLDELDWSIDYYNGILFVQDYDASKIPKYARGFVYVGNMLSSSLVTTGSNLGTGEQIFSGSVTGSLQFKSIKAGNNVTVTSDATSITISSEGGGGASSVAGLKKFVKILEAGVSAGNAISFTDLSLGTVLNTSGSVDVFYNGQILVSGSQAVVSAGNADYYTSNHNSFKFAFDLEVDDIVTVKQIQVASGSASSADYYVLASDNESLANARVLTAGDGITISTATPREITINSSGLISRSKTFHDVTASWTSGVPFHPLPGINFSTSNYDFNKIDVIFNGQTLRSGSNYDYVLLGTGSIVFDFALEKDDVVQVTTF